MDRAVFTVKRSCLQGNVINSMAGCPVLCRLTSLELGCNRIQAADFSALPTTLKLLSLEGNAVPTLNGAIHRPCKICNLLNSWIDS